MRGTASVTKKRNPNSRKRSDSLQHLPCAHPGCTKSHVAKGFCHKHWKEQYIAAMTPAQKAAFIRSCNSIPEPTRPEPPACECCGRPKRARLVVDHDHLADEFRGWLCDSCNSAIGN